MKNEANELMLKNKSLCKVLQKLICDSSSPFWKDATKEKKKITGNNYKELQNWPSLTSFNLAPSFCQMPDL